MGNVKLFDNALRNVMWPFAKKQRFPGVKQNSDGTIEFSATDEEARAADLIFDSSKVESFAIFLLAYITILLKTALQDLFHRHAHSPVSRGNYALTAAFISIDLTRASPFPFV
jgi:hypothetical protein